MEYLKNKDEWNQFFSTVYKLMEDIVFSDNASAFIGLLELTEPYDCV